MNNILPIIGAISAILVYIFGFLRGKKNQITKENENVVKNVQKSNEIKQDVMLYSDSKLNDAVQKWNKARDKANK